LEQVLFAGGNDPNEYDQEIEHLKGEYREVDDPFDNQSPL
jgi:hypothetical protein